MNIFQSTYEHRLREWKDLRMSIPIVTLSEACVRVDKWWQQAPLINHHLHPQDTDNWPDPWTILSDNTYCTLTRAIGICYTLIMSNIGNIQLVQASNELCEEHNLVIVGKSKYVLNYHPGSVLSTCLKEFKVSNELSLDKLYKNIK